MIADRGDNNSFSPVLRLIICGVLHPRNNINFTVPRYDLSNFSMKVNVSGVV